MEHAYNALISGNAPVSGHLTVWDGLQSLDSKKGNSIINQGRAIATNTCSDHLGGWSLLGVKGL